MPRDGKFADAIGLDESWPNYKSNSDEMTISADLLWAHSFLKGVEALNGSPEINDNLQFLFGPYMHNVGMATELTLKAFLKGAGITKNHVRKIGHNTYSAYVECSKFFDELKLITLVMSNTAHLTIPDEVANRHKGSLNEANREWRCFFQHLRILDQIYDRPFRTRYQTPGDIITPESYIIIVGLKILIEAMSERLNLNIDNKSFEPQNL